MPPAAAAHPLFDAQPYDPYLQERVLTVQLLKQACEDLRIPGRRAEARDFLVRRFWDTPWRLWLPSHSKDVVERYVDTACRAVARTSDVEHRPPAPRRAVVRIVREWYSPQGARRAWVELSCGHSMASYPRPRTAACRRCLLAAR